MNARFNGWARKNAPLLHHKNSRAAAKAVWDEQQREIDRLRDQIKFWEEDSLKHKLEIVAVRGELESAFG